MKKIPGLRWYIVVMLCLASELNYLDRQTLSVLAQTIQDEMHITTVQYADITFAFLISYTVMYAVSGRLVDWLGTRRSFLVFVSGWSLANALHAFARTAGHFTFFRVLLGATEPANFPAGVRTVTEWFPMRERALAVGIFNAGTALGAALAAPLVAWIALTWGWRYAFVFGGALGLVWVAVWAVVYRRPRQHPWLGADELALIEAGSPPPVDEALPAVPIRRLLGMKAVWGCIMARVLTDPISYLFIFWTPKFLQQERGFDLADIGKYSWIPFVGLALGNVAGGAVPGWLMRRGWSHNRARKTMMLAASCTMPVCFLLVTRVPSAAVAVALISVAMFAHAAWGNITLPAEVFPPHVVGAVTGFGGALGSLAGAFSQKAIGWTAQNLSFTPIFAVGSVMHLTGFALVCLLIGELGLERDVSGGAAPPSPSTPT
ncbi:MAG: MFS transporter [Opitutus sp.]|nr:MFS transporter [Opitutus sp.]